MTRKTSALLLAALLTSAVVAPASATDITIKNFVGKVTVIEGTDGLDVVRDGKETIDFRDSSDDIFIDGGLNQKERGEACDGSGMSWNLDFGSRKSQGNTKLEDYPELLISVPNGSNLTIEDSALHLDAAVTLGVADIDVGGCFDLTMAAVDTVRLMKSGSGDIEIGTARTIDIDKSGSGDVEIGDVGRFDLEQSGSGDADIDRINGAMSVEKSGSGDIDVGALDGNLSVEKSGSGNVDIASGTISKLTIRNSGSGDVDVDAAVGDAYVRASGSGDVYVKSISGALDETTSGSSDFKRGDD